MPALDPFIGVWLLEPESCRYEAPLQAPASGVYTILAEGEGLWFHVRWRMGEGAVQEAAYRASSLDGEAQLLDEPGQTMTTKLEQGALVSVVEIDGQPVHVARRSVTGERMQVSQELRVEDRWRRSESSYRRVDVKQVLVYRRDLKMRKGKIAAQCAHASMAVFFRRKRGSVDEPCIPLDGPMAAWVGGRFTKVCLSVEGEAELLAAHAAARAAGLPCALITDAGRTEFRGVPTKTALAIGPAATPEIDAITGPGGLVTCKLA
jgi:PTH2 family peptidyl-tRNA hydrolase